MSDDKKNIFDSATVIVPSQKLKDQTVSKVVPKMPTAAPTPTETKSFIKNQDTITDMASLTLTETETDSGPSKFEKLRMFNPRNHPKSFGIVAGIVVVLAIHFLMPSGDSQPSPEKSPVAPATPPQPAKVEAQTPPETAAVAPRQTQPQAQQQQVQQTRPMVQNTSAVSRYPSTQNFLKELEAGMRQALGK